MLNELHLTMSLDEPLTADERKELHDLLCDALAEFRRVRTPAQEYVDERYPDVEGYRWLNREKKVVEVEGRCMLAEKLRNAVAGSLRVGNGECERKLTALIDACKDAVWVHGGVRDWNPCADKVAAFDKALADAQKE